MLRCVGAPTRLLTKKKKPACLFLVLHVPLATARVFAAAPSTVRTCPNILSPPCRRACPWPADVRLARMPKIDPMQARSHGSRRRGETNRKIHSGVFPPPFAGHPGPRAAPPHGVSSKIHAVPAFRQPHTGAGAHHSPQCGHFGVCVRRRANCRLERKSDHLICFAESQRASDSRCLCVAFRGIQSTYLYAM